MIEKMKMVCVLTTVSGKEQMLEGLRSLGVVHLAEKQSADRKTSERFSQLSKTAMALKDYLPEKQKLKEEILSDEEFEKMYNEVLGAFDTKTALMQTVSMDVSEIDRVSPWGDFSPADVKYLKDNGALKVARSLDDGLELLHVVEVECRNGIAAIDGTGKHFTGVYQAQFFVTNHSVIVLN